MEKVLKMIRLPAGSSDGGGAPKSYHTPATCTFDYRYLFWWLSVDKQLPQHVHMYAPMPAYRTTMKREQARVNVRQQLSDDEVEDIDTLLTPPDTCMTGVREQQQQQHVDGIFTFESGIFTFESLFNVCVSFV
jgi:hypothetical protein